MHEPNQFESLLADYRQMVFGIAFRLLANVADAEDITQEVFVRLWGHYPDRVQHVTVGGWLKRVTRNLCLNFLQRHRARWKTFTDFTSEDRRAEGRLVEAAAAPQMESSLLDSSQRQMIAQALTTLPTDQRAALVLYHFEDMDYAGIATQLGVSMGKVKTDIFRGRRSLRPKLKPIHESMRK